MPNKTLVKMNFDPDIAKVVGTDAAIIFENIAFWVDISSKNNKNFHDNKFWTYNSVKAFSEQFIWLSTDQINRCLNKLESKKLIVTGNYNATTYDRTKWYSIGDSKLVDEYRTILRNRQMETAESQNPSDENAKPIPDINTNENTNNSDEKPKRVYKKELNTEDLKEIAESLSVATKDVEESYNEMLDYIKSKNKRYTDYAATLRNWVRRRIKSGEVKKTSKNAPQGVPEHKELTEEQRQKNIEKLAEIRKKMRVGKGFKDT